MTEVNSLSRSHACIKPCLFLVRQCASPAVLHPVLCPGSPNASLRGSRQNCSPLGTRCVRIYSISVLRVLSLCFPRICGKLSAARWALRFFCFVLFYLLEAIVSEWELLDDRLCSFVCCLLCYSGLLSKIQSRCSGISKNPFAVACIVFCCHLFIFLSNLILKGDLPQ